MDEGKQTELLEWHPKELQDIFERLVLECSTRRKTTLLIDAVDEVETRTGMRSFSSFIDSRGKHNQG
jgi:hypothetical protein